MTVIAFRPRPAAASKPDADSPVPLAGTFRSPRGRTGHLQGSIRVRRLVIEPRGAFVTGVFTGELREDDGSLIGVDTRRATIEADLVRHGDGYLPVLRPFQLDLMGLTVDVASTPVDPALVPDWRANPGRPGWPEPVGGLRG
jgi:hypothetical protein